MYVQVAQTFAEISPVTATIRNTSSGNAELIEIKNATLVVVELQDLSNNSYIQYQLLNDQNNIIACGMLNPQVMIFMTSDSEFTLKNESIEVHISPEVQGGESSTASSEPQQKQQVETFKETAEQFGAVVFTKNKVAKTIDDATLLISDGLLYGTKALVSLTQQVGRYTRNSIPQQEDPEKNTVPAVIKQGLKTTHSASRFVSSLTGAAIDVVVDGVSTVSKKLIAPLVPAKGTNANASMEVLSSTFQGISTLIGIGFHSAETLVKEVGRETKETIEHGMGNDAAEVAENTFGTAYHCLKTYRNTTPAGVVRSVAQKSAVKTIKHIVEEKEQQPTSSATTSTSTSCIPTTLSVASQAAL